MVELMYHFILIFNSNRRENRSEVLEDDHQQRIREKGEFQDPNHLALFRFQGVLELKVYKIFWLCLKVNHPLARENATNL